MKIIRRCSWVVLLVPLVCFSQLEWSSLDVAVEVALGGTLVDDHIGTEKTRELKARIARNSAEANRIVSADLDRPGVNRHISDIFILNVLRLTQKGDPQGASDVLNKYIKILDDTLANFSSHPDAERRLGLRDRLVMTQREVYEFRAEMLKREPSYPGPEPVGGGKMAPATVGPSETAAAAKSPQPQAPSAPRSDVSPASEAAAPSSFIVVQIGTKWPWIAGALLLALGSWMIFGRRS